MRFRISLRPEKERVRLPYNYNYFLASAIYAFLNEADVFLADFFHDHGFRCDGKAFKLFTFSPLFSRRREIFKDGIALQGSIDWFISSPREEFVSGLARGILRQGFLGLMGQRLIVEKVEVLKAPELETRVRFRTLSPIVVSTGAPDGSNRLRKKYLNPEDPEFERILGENLRRKYEACYGRSSASNGVSVELLRKPQSKLLEYKGIKIRGWFMNFLIQGDVELIKVGYEAGFGENNSAGFGMVEVETGFPRAAREQLACVSSLSKGEGETVRAFPLEWERVGSILSLSKDGGRVGSFPKRPSRFARDYV